MTKNKIAFIVVLFLMLLTENNYAQPYATGIGFRLGGVTSGITVKHFLNMNSALEGIVSFGGHSLLVTALYERHQEIPKAEGLSWFYGGGAHIGFFNAGGDYEYFYYNNHKNNATLIEHTESKVSFGADFILGLDYKFKNVPIDLSLDAKPFVDLVPGFYGYWEGALSFRFTL